MLEPILEEDAVAVNGEYQNDNLLGTLNFDCLEKIFNDLSTTDLLNLCDINPIVCNAVKERIVRKQQVNISDWNRIWSTERVFKELGFWIKNMAIGEHNLASKLCSGSNAFDYLLHLLAKHCAHHMLDSLSICFDVNEVNGQLLNAVRPHFTELREFQFKAFVRREYQQSSGLDHLLITVVDSAKNLNTIKLEKIRTIGTWLRLDKMKNVESIALINTIVTEEKNVDYYLSTKPKRLTSFEWVHASQPNKKLCQNVVQNCANLERFVDVQHTVEPEYLREDFAFGRYDFLLKSNNLKRATITSYTRSAYDLSNLIEMFAQKNTVEHLGIHFIMGAIDPLELSAAHRRVDTRRTYGYYTSLKSLDIQNNPDCMFWGETVINFMIELVNLKNLAISGTEIMNPVQLARMVIAPINLKVLKINNTVVDHLRLALDAVAKVKGGTPQMRQILTIFINRSQQKELEGNDLQMNAFGRWIKFKVV